MKRFLVIAAALASLAGGASAQQATVQCRWLAKGDNNFLQSDETLVNGMACRAVGAKQAVVAPAKPSEPVPAPEPRPVIVPEPNTVFIAPMDGFGTYLAAAFSKKGVPLTVVADEDHAAYAIRGTSDEQKAGWAKIVMIGDIRSDDAASVQMIDRKTDVVVFAYAVNKKSTWHGQQTSAEACAKHLKEQLVKQTK